MSHQSKVQTPGTRRRATISRRAFLRLAASGVVAGVAGGCTRQQKAPTATTMPVTEPTAATPLPVPTATPTRTPLKPYAVAPAEWPLPRRDNHGVARSPLKGAIRQPKVLCREFLGSSVNQLLVTDLDGSGRPWVFSVSGGCVVALDSEGKELWRSEALDVSFLEGVHDLAGDGRRQLVVLKWGGVAALDTKTGKVAWQFDIQRWGSFGAFSLKVGRVDLKRKGEQIVFIPYSNDWCYMFAFDRGLESGYVAWNEPDNSEGFLPSPVVADVDGDGANEVLIMYHHRVVVFDAATGREKQRLEWQNKDGRVRNYGYLGLLDVEGKGAPQGMLLSVGVAYHAELLDFSGEGQVRWSEYLGGGADTTIEPEGTPQPCADVDGDGALELVYNMRYERPEKKGWFLQVRDVRSGALKKELADTRLVDMLDLNDDKVPELVVERVTASSRTVAILSLVTGQELVLGDYDLQIDITRRYGLAEANTYYPFGGFIVRNWLMCADLDGDGRLEFVGLDRKAGKRVGLGVAADGKVETFPLPDACQSYILWAGNLDRSGKASYIVATGDGLRFVGPDGSAGRSVTGGSYSSRPLLADLDGDGKVEIVVGGRVLAFQGGEKPVLQERWSLPLNTMSKGNCVALWDLDLDGKKEVIAWEADEAKAIQMVVYDAAGKLRWRANLPEHGPGSSANQWTVGRFQGRETFDIYVAGNRASTGGASLVLDGQTGKTIWMETKSADRTLIPHGGYATVTDIDGDGTDDIALVAGGAVEYLKGQSGERIGGSMSMIGIMASNLETYYYGSMVFVDANGDGEEEVLLSGVWGGIGVATLARDRIWSRSFEIPSRSFIAPPLNRESAIGDVDGDGKLEVLCHIPNYKLRCYVGMEGKDKWTLDLDGGNPSELITCDIDGDGRDEVLYGTNLGHLFAVRGAASGAGEILFRLDMSGAVGVPVVGDVNGDGKAEIIVVTSDGYLNVIGA